MTRPTQPLDLRATDLSPLAITMEWYTPADAGASPIDGYVVQYGVAGSGYWLPAMWVAGAATLVAVLDGLRPGMWYDVRVAAKSAAGTGPWSAVATVKTDGVVAAPAPAPGGGAPFDAATITTGTLSAARLPAFTGDATSPAGSGVLTLAPSGVTAGTYNASATQLTPLTLDAKGRVTATGAPVTIAPAWASITGKPTTLAGYGIVDGLGALPQLLVNIGALPASAGLIRKTGPDTVALDSSVYLTANQTITLSGDATGSGTTGIAVALSNTGVTAGTYGGTATQNQTITVDAKGRVTAVGSPVTIAPAWSSVSGKPSTLSGFGITDAQPLDADLTSIAGLAGTSGLLRKTAANTWALDTGVYLTGNQTITVSGDATGSGSTTLALTLANTGVTAGTHTKVTVDAKGRVTAGAALSAGDVPTLTAAKISDFNAAVRANALNQLAAPTADVSMGGWKITSLATPTAPADAVTKAYVDSALSGVQAGPVNIANVIGADREFATLAARDAWVAANPALLGVGMYAFIQQDSKTFRLSSTSPVTWQDVSPPVDAINTGMNLAHGLGTSTNVGEVYKGMEGVQLAFRTIFATGGLTLTQNANYLQIDGSGIAPAPGPAPASAPATKESMPATEFIEAWDQSSAGFVAYDKFAYGGSPSTPVSLTSAGQWGQTNALTGTPTVAIDAAYRDFGNGLVVTELDSGTAPMVVSDNPTGAAFEVDFQVTGLPSTSGNAAGTGNREVNVYFDFVDGANFNNLWLSPSGQLFLRWRKSGGSITIINLTNSTSNSGDVGGLFVSQAQVTGGILKVKVRKVSQTAVKVWVWRTEAEGWILRWDVSANSNIDKGTTNLKVGFIGKQNTGLADKLRLRIVAAQNGSTFGIAYTDPNGFVEPDFKGQMYFDKSTSPHGVYVATGTTNTTWVKLN